MGYYRYRSIVVMGKCCRHLKLAATTTTGQSLTKTTTDAQINPVLIYKEPY